MKRYQPLSMEVINALFFIDADNGKLYWKNVDKAHKQLNGFEAGGPVPSNKKQYWVVTINKQKYKRSHIIIMASTGLWPENQVDHINGDSLDDRKDNLRHATELQNAWNHKKRKRRSELSAALPMGVRRNGCGFAARIGYKGKLINIGTYKTVDDAASAYKEKRSELFGEFA